MKLTQAFTHVALVSGSLIGASVLGFAGTAAAEPSTLVTCGPNGAAYIVEIVPAGCRHLAGTSAPNHSPENTVAKSRLNFTFNAKATQSQPNETVAATTQGSDQYQVPVALW